MSDKINSLSSKVTKYKTYSSVTTDANGAFTLDDLTTSNSIITCIDCSVSYAAINAVGAYGGKWIIQAREFSSGALKKNSGIGTITVYYIEK